MPGSNGSLQTAQSVQVTDQEPQLIGSNILPMTFFSADGVAPCWEDGDRDWWLRYFWRQFGNDLLQAFLAASVAKVVTQNFTIEGPEKKAEMYHRIIRDEFDFGKGYTHGLQRGVVDYYTQDNGWFIERLRSGPSDHTGPCLGLAHLDSQRMHPSGNDEFPYYYLDVGGEYHLMHKSQYIRIVDMPDSATLQYGDERGFCALSRALSTAMILSMLVTMKREKLSDLPPSAIAVFNNINRKQFESALTMHSLKEDHKGNVVWRSVLPLFGIDPAHPAALDFISFREVWEGFEERTAWDIAAYSFAAAWRMDVREVWPASQGPLGTGKEAEVQHQKAKSKSTGLLFTSLERSFNSKDTLPADVNFKFQIQDADEEQQKIAIHKEYISNIKTMQDAGATLSPEEVRYLLIQQKVLPRGFEKPLAEGESLDTGKTIVYIDDTEQQVIKASKEFWGPTVIIDSYGIKTYVEQGYRYMTGSKGGPGSGHWGHAGRPGQRGGGRAGSSIQIVVGAERRAAKIGKPAESTEPNIPLYDTADQIAGGHFGKGYFIRNDGKLVDISSDFGGATNDHVGYIVASGPGGADALGLDQSKIDAFKVIDGVVYGTYDDKGNRLTPGIDFEGPNADDLEFEWQDRYVEMWEDVWAAGNTRVRAFKHETAIDGLAGTSSNIKKLQNWVLEGKIDLDPTKGKIGWETDKEFIRFSWSDLMTAKNVSDLRLSGKSLDTDVLEISKELYMLAGEKDDGETIFDKVAKLPPKERAKVRARARKLPDVMSANKRLEFLMTGSKGGPGSGFRGHAGMPGKRGGSAPKSIGPSPITDEDEKWKNSLTEQELDAVMGYMNAGASWKGSAAVNGALRSGDIDVRMQSHIDLISSAISKAPRSSSPVTLYRSLPADASIGDSGFVSAMRQAKYTEPYNVGGRVTKSFTVPSGTPIASVSSIFMPFSEEVLLPLDVSVKEGSKDVLEISKELYMLAGEKDDGETIFDKVAKLPPKERAKVRARARQLQAVMSANKRLEFLMTGIPDEEWDAAVQADELQEVSQ